MKKDRKRVLFFFSKVNTKLTQRSSANPPSDDRAGFLGPSLPLRPPGPRPWAPLSSRACTRSGLPGAQCQRLARPQVTQSPRLPPGTGKTTVTQRERRLQRPHRSRHAQGAVPRPAPGRSSPRLCRRRPETSPLRATPHAWFVYVARPRTHEHALRLRRCEKNTQ